MSKFKCDSCGINDAKFIIKCNLYKWERRSCAEHRHGFMFCGEDVIINLDEEINITFNQFSEINAKRCESPEPEGFNENIKGFGSDHWLKAFQEEAGEISGALLGMTGKKKRKSHLTREDVLDEIGDAVACLDLLAQSLDSTLGECAVRKFNKISDRIGSSLKI